MEIIIEGYLNRFVEEFELVTDEKEINFENKGEIYKKSTTNAIIEEFKKRYK